MKQMQVQAGLIITICPDCEKKNLQVELEPETQPEMPKVYRFPGHPFPLLEIIANHAPVISKCPTCETKFRERVIVERWDEEDGAWVY